MFHVQCAVKLQKIMQEKVHELLEFDQVSEIYLIQVKICFV